MDEVKVGGRVIALGYTKDGCEFCAPIVRKIYRDTVFSDIIHYDLGEDEFVFIEREEFITKKQALEMLG